MHNPLKRSILEILTNSDSAIKEYDLHKILDRALFQQFVNDCSAELGLYRKHFLIMNALYELHEELLAQGLRLHISALVIKIEKAPDILSDTQELTTDTAFAKLSQYYRDWSHFYETGDKEVAALLQNFWNQFLALDEKTKSLNCLGLDEQADWPRIQQQYRRLCQQHHPDKGGDTLQFLQIREAYDNLKSLYGRLSFD